MERVRLADGLPVILERRHVVASHCRTLADADLTGSIYKVWKEQFNLDVEGAEESIRAVNIRREETKLLGTYPDTAALCLCGLNEPCTAETPTNSTTGSVAFKVPASPSGNSCPRE
jgi:DNA-binding GntR family transcriptional regulator